MQQHKHKPAQKPSPLVTFVCTGNVCRSPMAEYLLRAHLGPHSRWQSVSAGMVAASGIPPSPFSVDVMKEHDIDIRPHRSRALDRELVDASAIIVVMASSHREQIRALFPGASEKVFLLKSFDPAGRGRDIADPIGLSVDVYRAIRDEIDAAMPGLISFMNELELDGPAPGKERTK